MFLSPLVAGETLKTDKENGYYWTVWYFAACALVCTLINIWVYIDDTTLRGGVLSMVDVPIAIQEENDRLTFNGANSREQSRDLIAEGIYNAKDSGPLESGSFGGKQM